MKARIGASARLLLLALFCVQCSSSGGSAGGSSTDTDTSGEVQQDALQDALQEITAPDGARSGDAIVVSGVELSLGMPWEDLVAALGAPDELLDLGAGDKRFAFDELGIAGMVGSAGGAQSLTSFEVLSGSAGRLDDALSIGDSREDARAALGEPKLDPFLDVWWYPTKGAGIAWSDSKVARIIVYTPTPTEN